MRGVAIALALAVVAGAGWYVMSAGEAEEPEAEDVAETSTKKSRAGRRRGDGSTGARARRDDFEPRRDGTLEQRVVRLEDEVAMLRRQLAVRGRVALGGSSSVDPEALADDPVLESHVRDIVEDERVQERERRDERRAERLAEFRTEALDELVKIAGITEDQRASIDGLWSTETERIIPLISEARAGDRSFREVREEIEGLHKETDEAVAAMLSETQYESYEELRPRGPGGGRGGRGGRGGPGGGPGRG